MGRPSSEAPPLPEKPRLIVSTWHRGFAAIFGELTCFSWWSWVWFWCLNQWHTRGPLRDYIEIASLVLLTAIPVALLLLLLVVVIGVGLGILAAVVFLRLYPHLGLLR
jgi:hypothetical protein